MIKEKIYTYLGTNGTITSPVYLEGAYSVCKVALKAEEGKMLSKDMRNFVPYVVVPEIEVDEWKEYDGQE